jgi:hypothetical protein
MSAAATKGLGWLCARFIARAYLRHVPRRRILVSLAVALAVPLAAITAAVATGAIEPKAEPALRAATPAQSDAAARTGVETIRGVAGALEAARRIAMQPERAPAIEWRRSRPLGEHAAGRLRRGVLLPARGGSFRTWDPIERRSPNRAWRRWGSDRLIRATLAVARAYTARHPGAPKPLIGDLSRPHGGDFGPQFGSIGHASHQNGLDIDVYYPRQDREPRPPERPEQVDVRLSQKLVDLFVAAGAEKVFVGPNLPLRGPGEVVVPLVHHDNHLHFRLPLR